MDEKEIAKFVVDYYSADQLGHAQEIKLILAKNPKVFNHLGDKFGVKHMLYKFYLSSTLFNAAVLTEIQEGLDFRQLLLTVRKYPEAIKYIRPTRRSYNRLVQEAIKTDASVIRFFDSPSAELKQLAISQDPNIVHLIKDRTTEKTVLNSVVMEEK
jgi:hypothetical protein